MKHNITFAPEAFDSYKEWATTDKQIFKKINELIQSIDRTPFEVIPAKSHAKGRIIASWQLAVASSQTPKLYIANKVLLTGIN